MTRRGGPFDPETVPIRRHRASFDPFADGYFLPVSPPSSAPAGLSALGAATGPFPGVDFVTPILGAHVFSGWGRPRPGRNGVHEGIDIEAQPGTPIFAAEGGTLEGPFREDFAGLFIRIRHPGGFVTRYMHLSSVEAPAGPVFRGQLVAKSGTSGTSGSGTPHLHFDVHLDRDRLDLFSARFGRPTTGFGTCRSFGCAVPSEPLIPVASYSARTIQDAADNNVRLYRSPRRPIRTLAIAVGVGVGGAWLLGRLG